MDIGESRSGFSWRTLVVTAYILQNVNGECRDSATWCPQYAHRCDESIFQTNCPLTCGVCTITAAATTSSSTTTARTVTGECRDSATWCPRNAYRCDESYIQTNCPLTCGVCTTTTAATTTSSSTTTARTVTAVGTGCIDGNCDQQCPCYDRKDCPKRNDRCPYGRCALGWRGFPDCSHRDCSVNNGGCRQKCVSGRVSNWCACWEGYVLQDDGVTCVENDSLCLRDRKGSEYRGTVSVTWVGETCRSWADVDYTQYDHNYCRNPPGARDPRPWCIVAPYPTHEPCNIALCTAVDPCHTSNHECPQECVSLQATSYSCRCYPGYSGNDQVCNDIDECSGDSHECSSREQCVNIAGGYYCECATGYRLDTDTNQCTACPSGTFGESCSGTCHCLDNSSCNHATGVCHDGQCAAGWTGYNCQSQCTRGSFGPSCGGVCHCRYVSYCDRVDGNCSGYRCEAGWRGDTCQQDVDECADRVQHGVDRRCHVCNNTDGSYTCDCNTGYQLHSTGRYCVDINECYNREESGVPASCYICDNLPGSYECRCDTGYEPSEDRKSCVDVDECADRIHHRVDSRCHECTNTDGSYTCDCDTGYQLYRRGRYCVDIDECNNREESGVPASCYRCDNLQGSYECRCYTGYEPSDDRKSCVDINECNRREESGVPASCQICENLPGSYECRCDTGYGLSSDRESCVDIDECNSEEESGVPASCHRCDNLPGSYECQCDTGYEPSDDRKSCDECTSGKFGVSCGEDCHCLDDKACNKTDGACPGNLCAVGWTGPSCKKRDSSTRGGPVGQGGDVPTDSNGKTTKIILAVIITILVIAAAVIGVIIIGRRYKTGFWWKPSPQDWPTTGAGLQRHGSDDMIMTVSSPPPATTLTTPPEVAVVLTNGAPDSNGEDDSNIYSNECRFPGNTWIAVDQLEKHVGTFDQSLESVKAEYKSIPTEKDHPRTIGQNPELSKKNRFKNIQPYDHNIVKLSLENNDDANTGYVNASWVEDHSGARKYIASQGPVKQTVNDFWKMVWEHNVCVIAMLTNLFENTKRKCEVYWPDDGCITKGQVTVTFVHQDIYPLMAVRNFLVSHASNPTLSRSVTQYHFTSWPDHGVPDQCTSLIRFCNKVRAAEVAGCPTLVHCSAGVGRTGTYLGLDLSMRQAASEGGIDIRACVDRMREYRMNMVQNVDQYIFLYRVVSEGLLLAGSTIPCHLLEESYLRKKREHCLDGSMTQLRKEIQMLNTSIDSEDDYKEANLAVNKKLNRTKIIPKDKARVRLMVPVQGRGNYINAVFVKGYKARVGTIATQYPLPDSVVDFWRMITDYRVSIVVILEEPDSTEIAPCKSKRVLKLPHVTIHWQGHSDKGLYSQTTVSVLATKRKKSSSEEEPTYTNNEQAGRQVRLFTARTRSDNTHGIPLATLLELRRETESWQAEKKTSNSPIVVVCRDGALYCGWYIAANIALDMMQNEEEVDIFFIVRQLKATRKEFISNLSEYESLLTLAVEYQKQRSDSEEHTYGNIG